MLPAVGDPEVDEQRTVRRSVSLCGSVQSSVMALMAGRGAFDRVTDDAVFADTHWEPPSISTHLE